MKVAIHFKDKSRDALTITNVRMASVYPHTSLDGVRKPEVIIHFNEPENRSRYYALKDIESITSF